MYTNVPDTSIHIPSVRGGLPGVLSRSRRKDLLVLRSMKARESAQDDARKGRVWILGWTRNAKRRAEQGRPGQGAMSLRRVIPFLAIALTRDARVSVIFFKCQSSRKPSFEVRKDRMARIYNGEPRWKARNRARQARHKRKRAEY